MISIQALVDAYHLTIHASITRRKSHMHNMTIYSMLTSRMFYFFV